MSLVSSASWPIYDTLECVMYKMCSFPLLELRYALSQMVLMVC